LISDKWHTGDPLVSVCVQTYQHAPYIRQTLDSILMQKTDFPFEILIGEDESTDGTREICIEYANKYPDIIRLFLNIRENVIYFNGHPTGRWNFVNNMKNARGKYIANLPGDDFWTHPLKLQKQVDILEKNNDIIACHHWHEYKYENGIKDNGTPKQGYYPKTVASVKEIFANRLRVKSRTIMFRNIIDDNFFPDWFMKVAFGDVPLSFLLGKYGNFYFIDEPMAVYRITGKGLSTTGKSQMDHAAWMKQHFLSWVQIWNYANNHYNYLYNQEAIQTIIQFHKLIIKTYKYSWKALFNLCAYNLFKTKDKISNKVLISNAIIKLTIKSKIRRFCEWQQIKVKTLFP
jgi:glycosyltransferase involved in cell wall biosynthesis